MAFEFVKKTTKMAATSVTTFRVGSDLRGLIIRIQSKHVDFSFVRFLNFALIFCSGYEEWHFGDAVAAIQLQRRAQDARIAPNL